MIHYFNIMHLDIN